MKSAEELAAQVALNSQRSWWWLWLVGAVALGGLIGWAVVSFWLPVLAQEEIERQLQALLPGEAELEMAQMSRDGALATRVAYAGDVVELEAAEVLALYHWNGLRAGELEHLQAASLSATVRMDALYNVDDFLGRARPHTPALPDQAASERAPATMPPAVVPDEALTDAAAPASAEGSSRPSASPVASPSLPAGWWHAWGARLPRSLDLPAAELALQLGRQKAHFPLALSAQRLGGDNWQAQVEVERPDLAIEADFFAPSPQEAQLVARGRVEAALRVWPRLLPVWHPWHPEKMLPRSAGWALGPVEATVEAQWEGRSVAAWLALVSGESAEIPVSRDLTVPLGAFALSHRQAAGQWQELHLAAELRPLAWQGWQSEGGTFALEWLGGQRWRGDTPQMGISGPEGIRLDGAWTAELDLSEGDPLQFLRGALFEVALPGLRLTPLKFEADWQAHRVQARFSPFQVRGHLEWMWRDWQVELTRQPGPRLQWDGTALGELWDQLTASRAGYLHLTGGQQGEDTRLTLRLSEQPGTLSQPAAPWLEAATQYNLQAGTGTATWSLAQHLERMGPLRRVLLPGLGDARATGWLSFQGSLRAEGLLNLRGSAQVRWQNGGWQSADGLLGVEGIEVETELLLSPWPRTRSTQISTFQRLRIGETAWQNGFVSWSLPRDNQLRIEELTAEWLGGIVEVEPTTLDPRQADFDFTLRCDNLAAEAFLALLAPAGFELTGRLDGALPLAVRGGQVFVQPGQMRLKPRPLGRFRWTEPRARAAWLAQWEGILAPYAVREIEAALAGDGLAVQGLVIDLAQPDAATPVVLRLQLDPAGLPSELAGQTLDLPLLPEAAAAQTSAGLPLSALLRPFWASP